MRTWATLKIEAAGSVLMAMMQPEFCMPATNCIAPETPQVMISFGLTVRPLRPIWKRGSIHPASTTARVEARRPPRASARSRRSARSSGFLTPRPATTRISAFSMPSSGGFFTRETISMRESSAPAGIAQRVILPCGSQTGGAEKTL